MEENLASSAGFRDDRVEALLETSSEYNLVWMSKGEAIVDLRNGSLEIWRAVLVRVGSRFKSLEGMARVSALFSGEGKKCCSDLQRVSSQ